MIEKLYCLIVSHESAAQPFPVAAAHCAGRFFSLPRPAAMNRTALFELDRERPQSLVEQLVDAVAGALAAHLLRAGMRMPSVRQLAQQQGISTFTVVEAYDRLVAQGVLVARRGAGFFVAGKGRSDASVPRREPGALDIG